jgi:hemerythrin-like metal-binding protein
MRQAVESLRIPHAQSPFGQVTISLGVAAKSSHRRDTIEGLIQAADEALYRAKQGGRNQVQAAACAEDAARTGGAGFVRLVWSAAYDCGHPLIDEQHRALFALANRLLAAILAGETQERIGGLVDALLECVEGHFRDEERLYSASAYPRSVEHTSSHRNLLDHARQMVERFRAGEGLGIGELFQFFAQELVAHHFLGADREFFPFLEAGRAP